MPDVGVMHVWVRESYAYLVQGIQKEYELRRSLALQCFDRWTQLLVPLIGRLMPAWSARAGMSKSHGQD